MSWCKGDNERLCAKKSSFTVEKSSPFNYVIPCSRSYSILVIVNGYCWFLLGLFSFSSFLFSSTTETVVGCTTDD